MAGFRAFRRVDRSSRSGGGAVDHQQFADMLDRSGTEFAADFFEMGDAVFTTLAINTNLDQFVGVQIDVDLLEHSLGEAVLGDRDAGIQAVGSDTQFAVRARR